MNDNSGAGSNFMCKFRIKHLNKVVLMDLGVTFHLSIIEYLKSKGKFVLDDLKVPLSKVLNASLFGKQLNFYYQHKNTDIMLDPQSPMSDFQDIIDFKKNPIEIDIHIEHIGA